MAAPTRNLTAANAVITLSCIPYLPTATSLQGFAAEDLFSAEPVVVAETQMGIDGILSAGFVFNSISWSFTLKADSISIPALNQVYAAERAALAPGLWQGVIVLPALKLKWQMNNGILVQYPPMPDTKKLIQPLKYSFEWESVNAAASA